MGRASSLERNGAAWPSRQHRDGLCLYARCGEQGRSRQAEWAPDPHPLGDRTAFDAYVEYRTDDGEPGFLGIETKYTELFSQKRYESDRYTEITEAPHSGFRPGASGRLASARTNQLWRNTMLALAHTTQRFNQGFSVVLHAAGDGEIGSAIEAFYAEREEPGSLLRVVTYERLIDAVAQEPGATEWAGGFRKRYLDLSPVR